MVARRSASFIKVGVAYMHASMCLKEELAWALDKWFQFTISYYTIPLEACKEAIH